MNKKVLSWALAIAIVVMSTVLAIVACVSIFGDDSAAGNGEKQDEKLSSAGANANQSVQTEPVEDPYAICRETYTDYILPESNSRYLQMKDVSGLSDIELTVAQQEILVRHGDIFEDSDLQAYFHSRSWYTPSSGTYTLNGYESANMLLLETCAAKKMVTSITSIVRLAVKIIFLQTVTPDNCWRENC